MIKPILFTVLALFTIQAFSNTNIDSLEKVLKTATGEQKVKTLNELFRAYINSDPIKAIGFAREALSMASEINDLKGMAASYNNLGVSYRNQGALDKALAYYLISIRLYDSLKNIDGVATTKNNIGTIYSLKKDYGQAMKYFEESYDQFTKMNEKQKIIGSLNNLGNLHSDLQLYEQALKYYSQALQMSDQISKISSDPLNNIGNLYFRQGNKAQTYFDSAMTLCKELQAYVYEPQILKNMAGNYYKQGKMKEAYDMMLRYDKAKEKIYGEESSRKIAQMEIALDLQAREKEVDALKTEGKIKSLELHNTRMVITIIVLSAIIALSLFNLFWHRK